MSAPTLFISPVPNVIDLIRWNPTSSDSDEAH